MNDWPTESNQPQMAETSNFNIIQALLGHKLLLIFCVAVGGGLGYLQFKKSPTIYASSARLRVVQTMPMIGVEGLNDRIARQDPLDTHSVLIRSPIVLDMAVKDHQLEETLGPNAVNIAAGGLTVRRSPESAEILDLTFTGQDQYICQKILNAVVAAYIKYLSESQQSSTVEALRLITEAKDDLLKDLIVKEKTFDDFRENASLLWSGEEASNIHAQRLASIEAKRSEIMLQRSAIQSQIDAIQDLIDRGESREAILLMIDQLAIEEEEAQKTSNSSSMAQKLIPLRLEEQIQIEKLGPGHPKVKEIQKRIELTRSYLEADAAENAVEPTVKKERPDILVVYMEAQRHEVSGLDKQLETFNELYTAEEAEAKLLTVEENRNRALTEDIQRTKLLFNTVLAKLQSAELTKDTGTLYAEPIIAPGPGRKVAPEMSKSVSMGCVLGLLAGLAISVMIELSDGSYRAPNDIAKHIGAPVIGHIPAFSISRERRLSKNKSVDPTLVTYHRPNSGFAEAYRNVRTALMLGTQGQHQVIQVTSPNPSDGKSTLSANIAITMARSGKRTLLFDCDFRRPKVHTLFKMENKLGVSSVINDGAELPDVIQSSPVDNLDILLCGPRVKNPAELLLSKQFAEILALVRDRYDIVIVDSPPVLAVSDAVTIASVCDGVVLAMQMSRKARPILTRVRENLSVVGANIIGIVVNKIDTQSTYGSQYGAYQYGHYQYSKYTKYLDEKPAKT